jgi:putative membrane protein
LRSLKRKAFEKSYLDNEVSYHEAVIHTIKTVLIPSAQNAEIEVSAARHQAPI